MTTDDEIKLIRYQRSDRERVFALVREVFPSSYSERLIRQWDWKYDANPFNRGGEPDIELLTKGEELVAMYGRLFYPVAVEGKEHLAHHACDLVVHPAYRGRNLSARLRGPRQHCRSDLHFSWQNEASYRVSSREGRGGVPFVSLFKPLDVARIAQHLLGDRTLGRTAGRVIDAARRLVPRIRRRGTVPGVSLERVRSFDERFDRLWQRACRDYPVMVVRDRRYLEWRFGRRPDARYDVIAVSRASELAGYMVTRSGSESGDWGYLVDFLVEERSSRLFSFLLDEAVESLRREGAVGISCRVAVPPYRGLLYRHGFVPLLGAPRGYLRATVRLANAEPRGLTDPGCWFLTMGDGDLEMSL